MKTLVLDPAPVPLTLAREHSRAHVQNTFVVDAQAVHVPAWIKDHASFRRWVHSDEFPERAGRICYLNGEVWVDMSKEQVFTHNQVKGEITFVLTGVIKAGRLGRFFPDGMLISNVEASLTAQPDGAFIASEGLRTGRIQLVEGKKEGYVELQGTPDMVLEVVSESSVEKDTITLKELYWRARIREYWLVNARGATTIFDILRYTARGYVAARKQAGWVKSAVFGKAFRLSQHADDLGNPVYNLAVR